MQNRSSDDPDAVIKADASAGDRKQPSAGDHKQPTQSPDIARPIPSKKGVAQPAALKRAKAVHTAIMAATASAAASHPASASHPPSATCVWCGVRHVIFGGPNDSKAAHDAVTVPSACLHCAVNLATLGHFTRKAPVRATHHAFDETRFCHAGCL
jgi:hypothetical protein